MRPSTIDLGVAWLRERQVGVRLVLVITLVQLLGNSFGHEAAITSLKTTVKTLIVTLETGC